MLPVLQLVVPQVLPQLLLHEHVLLQLQLQQLVLAYSVDNSARSAISKPEKLRSRPP